MLFTLWGYRHYGWLGAGVGMALARALDLAVVYSIAHLRYGFRLSMRAARGLLLAVAAGTVVILSVLFAARFPWLIYVGYVVAVASVAVSLYCLSRSGNILSLMLKRIFKR